MYLLYAIPVAIILVVLVVVGGGPVLLLPFLIALPLMGAYLLRSGAARRPDEVSGEVRRADQPEASTPERGGIWGERGV
jgi:UPF0716 family protein affecting phage T7 exclusion